MIPLNPLMLLGIAALAIPLVIHLFNRSRFRVVKWGAMHLLESVVRVNKRRIKIEQLILLLIRCAIPVILALLMARPVITGWRALAGDAPASVAILLDDSYSMQAGGTRTRFAAAVDEAERIIGDLKQGSDVSVILLGNGQGLFDRPTFNREGLTEQLRQLPAGFGAVDTVGSFDAALAAMDEASTVKRDIILLSDFQAVNWDRTSETEIAGLSERINGMNVKPSLTFFNVGGATTDNIAVESVALVDKQVVGVGEEVRVRAHLRNHGRKSYSDLRVYFRVDGEEVQAVEKTLEPGGRTQVLFKTTFEEAGSHVIEVEADADDLKADNTYLTAVNVLGRIGVLLVNGDVGEEPLEGETDFLYVALQPFAAGKSKLAELVETRTIEPHQLNGEALADTRVVVLANIEKLKGEQVEQLRQFVLNGGGLMVFLGNRIDSNWYNDTLAGGSAELLPVRIEALAGSLTDETRQSAITAQHFDHPALSLFNDRRNGNLADARVWKWYRLADPGLGSDPARPTVMARLETGDPLLVERKLGQGVIVQAATAADADWSNLPALGHLYLPLMQQVTTYLAASLDPPRNVEVDQPLVAVLPSALGGRTLKLTDPAGRVHELEAKSKGGRALVEFAETRGTGLYVLAKPGGEKIHFVVNTARTESKLDGLEEPRLEAIAQAMGASVVGAGDEYAELDGTRRKGREIWRVLLVALLVFCFGELFLQQWFTRGRA